MKKAKADPQWAHSCIISYNNHYKRKFANKEISSDAITGYFNAVKSFYEMNDLQLNWKRIRAGLPKPRSRANDRSPTLEEIRKLCEHPDRRIKVIVYVMCSSGIRIGAWDYLKWKHVKPITNAEYLRWKKQYLAGHKQDHSHIMITKEDEEKIIAAKLEVYAGEPEEYYSFITPEAYFAIKDYMDFRDKYGEKITGESWLIRDRWKTTNVKYSAKRSLAKYPKKLAVSAIKKLLNRAIWQQNLRQPLEEGVRRHEYKTTHSFRKYFKTHAQFSIQNSESVEFLMGHKTGLSGSYNRPVEYQMLDEYLKAVDILTINNDAKVTALLQKQVTDLTEKSEQENNAIFEKLAEKDKQIDYLTQEYGRMNEVLTKTAGTMSSMLEMFEDQHNRGGKSVSAQKSFKFTSDVMSAMKAASLADGLSEKDFYILFDDAMLGNRAEMEKRLKKVRGNSKSLKEMDKRLIIAMEAIAQQLRNEKIVTEIYEGHM